MKRFAVVAVLCFITLVAGCDDDSPTSPSDNAATFNMTLTTANEVPPVTGAEAGGFGNVTIRLSVTRNAANAISAATADFSVSLAGFPASTTFTGAHIHEAATGANGPVRVNTGLTSGDVPLVNGGGGFTKNGVNITDLSMVQRMLDTPPAFYFNVHSTVSPGGVIRAQLVRTQ